MLLIDSNNKITLTRGDTMSLNVTAKTKDGDPYVLQDGETMRMAISNGFEGQSTYVLMLSKSVTNGSVTFSSTETKTLDYKTYNYDVEITHTDGTVDTFISSTITIVGESE